MRGFHAPYRPNIPRVPGDARATVDASLPLFVVGRRNLTSVLAFGEPEFEFFISRNKAGISFAGGAITYGVRGCTERGVTGVTGVADFIKYLNLKVLLSLHTFHLSHALGVTNQIGVTVAFTKFGIA